MKLKPMILKSFFEKSIFKLAQDQCNPDFTIFQGHNERRSLLRPSTVLISRCFSETWTRVTALPITDSLSARLNKFAYCKYLSGHAP